jgi:hypothetical protein
MYILETNWAAIAPTPSTPNVTKNVTKQTNAILVFVGALNKFSKIVIDICHKSLVELSRNGSDRCAHYTSCGYQKQFYTHKVDTKGIALRDSDNSCSSTLYPFLLATLMLFTKNLI